MPTAQTSACKVGTATEPPSNSPRSAVTMWLIGLTFTQACNQPGMDEVAAKMLLPNVSGNITRNTRPCTDSGPLATMPTQAVTQHTASANSTTSTNAATAASALVCTRKPSTKPNASTIAPEMT